MPLDDYTPTPQWPSNRPVLTDGEQPIAANLRITQEDMYDRLEHLEEGGKAAQTITRHFGLGHMVFNPTKWTINDAQGCVEQVSAANGDYVYVRIRIPHGARITSISARLDPTHNTLPAEMPSIMLARIPLATAALGSAWSSRGTQSDTSGNPAYGAAHSITRAFSSPNELVDNDTYDYWVRFEGESGAGSANGLQFFGVSVTFITSTTRDGGAA